MKRLRVLPAERLPVREDLPASSLHCCTARGFCRGGWARPRQTAVDSFFAAQVWSPTQTSLQTRVLWCAAGEKLVVFPGRRVMSGQFSLQKCRANFPRTLLLSSLSSSSSSLQSSQSLSLCGSPASASCECGTAAPHHYCPPSCSLHLASWLLHIYWFCVYLCSSCALSWLCQHCRLCRRHCSCCWSSPPSFAFPPRASPFSSSSFSGKISLIASESFSLCQTWTFLFFGAWLFSWQSFCH